MVPRVAFTNKFHCILFQYVKPDTVSLEPRRRKRGASKTGRHEKRKKGMKEELKRKAVKEAIQDKQHRKKQKAATSTVDTGSYDPLKRFNKS